MNVLSQDSSQEVQTDTSVPFLDIVYNESELDSSYKDKQSVTETEESSSSNVLGYVWTMTLSELHIPSFGKKEMTTTNEKIKSMYDNAHKDAMNKVLKPGDVDKRLFLSALFDCLKSIKIMEPYLVPLARLPESTISSIKSMEKAIDKNTIMKVGGAQFNSVEELALHHITLDIYLNHSVISSEWKQSGELDFIARSVSCLFGSLWSPHDKVIVLWYVKKRYYMIYIYVYTDLILHLSSYRDFTTWINKQKMPDTVSSRPDMVFSTKLFEIGNGEVKPANTPKASIDLSRARVLETCKRQLHLRLKNANSMREAVTFGVLIYGK